MSSGFQCVSTGLGEDNMLSKIDVLLELERALVDFPG